jgi:hypothetical protein
MPGTKLELDMLCARSAAHTLHAQLVFVSNYRRPALTDPTLTCCEQVALAYPV